MRFFTRCRVLMKVLVMIDVILGIVIVFRVPEIPEAICLSGSICDRTLLSFAVLCLMFALILLTVITLTCIIKDVDEDMNAVVRMQEQKTRNIE